MALGRYVIGTTVTVPGGTYTANASSIYGTGSYAGTGTGATLQWADGFPATFFAGQTVWADPSATSTPTGSMQLYTALTAAGANLRAYADTDLVGRYGISN